MEFSSLSPTPQQSPLLDLHETSINLDINYKLMPWISWDEWDFVRLSLFSSSPHSISQAFRRIAAWRSRGCLPVAVEVTASFIEIQQKDPFFNGELSKGALDSEELLAMLYTMAAIRLVNGMVEKTRKRTKESIADAAAEKKIPRLLIDIRHEGAHRELPSLHLLRRASTEALDWIKSYYWDRQKNAIPYQSGRSANLRKEIRSRLRELAFSLKFKHSSGASSADLKGKRATHPEQLLGTTVPVRSKLFSLVACKSRPKYVGSKKQSMKILKNLVRLYSFFSSDVVSVVLELLLKAPKSKDSLKSQEKFHINLSLEVVKGAFDEWKPVIAKFAKSEPDLLLSLLKAVLDLVESRKTSRDDFGREDFTLSSYDLETERIGVLSLLFSWLVQVLKGLSSSQNQRPGNGTEGDCCIPRSTLMELVKSCLRIAAPENHELLDSALLMAKMVGSSHLNERIEKLSRLSSLYTLRSHDDPSDGNLEVLINQDKYIRQAAQKLEMVKSRKLGSAHTIGSQDEEDGNIWTIAKSWNPCPIGMLPRLVGSSGCLPVLDYGNADECKISSPSTDDKDLLETRPCKKRNTISDGEAMDDSSIKRMRMTEAFDSAEPDDMNVVAVPDNMNVVSVSDGVEGRLLIGGVYQKVTDQETQDILSRLRVLVQGVEVPLF